MKLNEFESIKRSQEITNLLVNGNKVHSKDVWFSYKQADDLEIANVVIIVPKKKFKLAVIRNKIRRQIRAILIETKILKDKKISLVLVAKNTYNFNMYKENKKQIVKLFNKLGGK